ncbi:MAG: hypothetical protein LBE35_05810 [Clostridiales bacterium]|nr:hypothetical protein [Clostridiales bacterium]
MKRQMMSERRKILDGTYPSRIIRGRQNKHIAGTKEFAQNSEKMQRLNPGSKPSILEVDAQALVDKFRGTGVIEIKPGSLYPRETIDVGEVIGKTWVKSLGKYVDTRKVAIIYSSDGVHVFPVSDYRKR